MKSWLFWCSKVIDLFFILDIFLNFFLLVLLDGGDPCSLTSMLGAARANFFRVVFFCRVGSTRAKECLPGARCPEGSAAMDFTTGGIVISTCIIAFVAAVTLGLLYSRKRKMLQLKKSLEVGVELKRAIKVLHQSEQIIRDHEKQMQKIEASMVKIEASMVRTSEASGEVEVDAESGCFKSCFQACLPQEGGLSKEMAEIGFHDLSLTVDTTGATVLDNLSGIIRPGQLTAIMGPSGSGKTSLMTAIAGRAHYGTLHGSLFLNGEPIDPKSRDYQRKIGFVPQHDIMHPHLTVFETLVYTSRIRLPEISRIEQMRNVNHAISQLR